MAAQPGVIIAAHLQAMQNHDPNRHQHLLAMRGRLVVLGGFSAAAAGPTDSFLLQHGATLLDPSQAAAMTFDEVVEMVEAHNKSNRDFGMGITVAMSMFVQSLVHHYRMLRAHGDPMDLAALRADLPNLDRARLDDARDHLRHMKELQSQSPGDAPEMTVGPTKFRVFLVDFTNYLSQIVGAYGIPMTYLTVPAVIDPANADHVRWTQVPRVGATYNRDNRHFFQILTPIVAKTKYKMLLVGVSAVRGDGRRLWLKIISTECGAGSNYQTLSVLRKALDLVYTGKNANLPFTDYYSQVKQYWDAEGEIGNIIQDRFKIDHVWKHIDLGGNYKLTALIAAEMAQYPDQFEEFMDAVNIRIVASGIENLAGTSALGKRQVNAVSPERGGEGSTIVGGVDCSEYVKPSGRIHVPGDVWVKKSQEFQDAVKDFNKALGGGRQRENKRQRSQQSRLIKKLRAENAKLKGEELPDDDAAAGDDEKGGTTGASIASQRGK